jgi:hypothetical protein
MTNQERFPYAIIGQDARIERGAIIGQGARIERGAFIGQGAIIERGDKYVTVLGFADGYWKTLTRRNSMLWINAGCRSFSAADALKHWGPSHKSDRSLTYALLVAGLARYGKTI